jgi:hypothetical protein
VIKQRNRSLEARDDGAVLILALVLLMAVSLTLGSLMTVVRSNLVATRVLDNQRGVALAADAALDGAIQTIRYQQPNSLVNPQCPTFPTSSGPTFVVNQTQIKVMCSMGIPSGLYGRLVEFDACKSTATTFAACQNTAILRANVVFGDVMAGCSSGATPGCYNVAGAWGTTVTLQSWNLESNSGGP